MSTDTDRAREEATDAEREEAWVRAALDSLSKLQPPWRDATGDNQEISEEKQR